MKILLVEDDSRQIEYAKIILKDYDLDVAVDTDEATKKIDRKSKPQIVLTDLHLPSNLYDKDRPNAGNGLSFFSIALRELAKGEIEGLALVSNFEHHVHESKPQIGQSHEDFIKEKEAVNTATAFLDTIGKVVFVYDTGRWNFVKNKNSLNVCSFIDKELNFYKHFLSPDGKIYTSEEKEQERVKESILMPDLNPYRLVPEGYLNLKPFHKIVEVLTCTTCGFNPKK